MLFGALLQQWPSSTRQHLALLLKHLDLGSAGHSKDWALCVSALVCITVSINYESLPKVPVG